LVHLFEVPAPSLLTIRAVNLTAHFGVLKVLAGRLQEPKQEFFKKNRLKTLGMKKNV